MKKIQFTIQINAPAPKVYDALLGLTDKSTYEQWTAEFNPTSTFEGNWNKDERAPFIRKHHHGSAKDTINHKT